MKKFSILTWLVVLALLAGGLAGCERKTKEQLLQEGLKLQQGENLTGAIVLYKNALEKDPNYCEARLQLGLAYLAWGNHIQAEKELEKVLLQDPKNGEVLLHLAKVHLGSRAPDKAFGYVERYLREKQETPLAFELLGTVRAQQGQMAESEKAYRKALNLDSAQEGARNGLARLYAATGRLAEARALLEDGLELEPKNKERYYLLLQIEGAAGNMEQAIAAGRRLLKMFPEEITAAYLVGILELQRNDAAAAGKLAADLVARYPKHPAGIRLQGLIHYAEGQYPEAAEKLKLSLRQMPDLAGRYLLGLTHYQLGDFELALNQFQAMLDEKPDHQQARLMVAQTLFRQKRFDDSRAAAELVLKAEPDNALAHDIVGSVCLAQGDYDRAMEELDRAIALAPHLVDAQLKKGLFNLARGKLEQAEEPLEEVVRLAPEVLNSRLLLAVSYLRRQDFNQAVATLKEGLQGRPEDAVLHNHLAAAYLGQGQTEAALAELEKAKQCKPDYLAPYVNLANYHLSKGKPDKAAAEYRALLKVAPQNLRALLSLAALQELQGDKEGVRECLVRAIATEAVEGFLAQALYQNRNGQPEQALKTLQSGLDLHPKQPALLELQGKVLLRQGKGAEALSAFRTLAEDRPAEGLPLLIATLMQQGQREEAEKMARGQIARQSADPQGYLLLAAIYKAQKEYAKGIEVLESGLKKVNNELALQMTRADLHLVARQPERAMTILDELRQRHPAFLPATFTLATMHDQRGDKRQALALYRACLEQDDDYLPALNNLAYLYADNYRDLDEALQLAVKAFRQKPAEPGIMDTLGYVLLRKGRFGDALPYLEKSAGLMPGEPSIQLHLALAYQGLGKKEQAVAAAQKVAASGNQALAQSAETLIRELGEVAAN